MPDWLRETAKPLMEATGEAAYGPTVVRLYLTEGLTLPWLVALERTFFDEHGEEQVDYIGLTVSAMDDLMRGWLKLREAGIVESPVVQ